MLRTVSIPMHASFSGPNTIAPDRMTPAERHADVGRILAAGAVRLLAQKSSLLAADGGGCTAAAR